MSKEAMKLALSALEYWDVHGKLHQPTEEAITALREALAGQPAQQEPVCQWKREDDDHMPDTWRGDCGALWTFTDGSPVDNNIKYCCGCGAILLEKNT